MSICNASGEERVLRELSVVKPYLCTYIRRKNIAVKILTRQQTADKLMVYVHSVE